MTGFLKTQYYHPLYVSNHFAAGLGGQAEGIEKQERALYEPGTSSVVAMWSDSNENTSLC